VHLAFGEAGLPVHPVLREMLDAAAPSNSYPPVAGTRAARDAAAGYFSRRDIRAQAESVVLAPGSKPLLFALLLALDGDLLLPQPSWVSYAAQAQLASREVIRIAIPSSTGGVPDPDLLRRWAAENPRRKVTLLVTVPDNPTGTVAGATMLRETCEIARRHGWWVVSDEIYRDLAYDQASMTSPAVLYPERTVVTGGLSKNLALGGWRIGAACFPDNEDGRALRSTVVAIASEVWSAMAAPMQEVAAFAFNEPTELRDHVASSRRLHRAVTSALYRQFADRAVATRPPAGGFYLYPDFEAHRAKLHAARASDSEGLARLLLERHDVATLPGAAFGDEPDRLTLRVAGSLLYGRTEEERWAALQSQDPVQLPWISDALNRVGSALDEVCGDPVADPDLTAS
jgi:aspartate aminotransferase